ncbi:MAG: Uma2 family endonuclease [Anaerolineae bacterium]|nr:Uma2 family endonuclease [Anaerolineae bacterium]MDW8173091.1 Uma2 family endonuclease [Anaerolineae bacterium]
MAQTVRVPIRAEDYFQRPEYAERDSIELIGGEIVLPVPPTPQHQRIVREILFWLTQLARTQGGEALSAPVELMLNDENVYQPDVLYLRPNSRCTVGEKRLTGAPDLVVEVLSPSTVKRDRQDKYFAYERHGVSEYWLVDPLYSVMECWVRGEESSGFRRLGVFSADESFFSPTLNAMVEVGAFLR